MVAMSAAARRSYDHRLRDLVSETGARRVAQAIGIPAIDGGEVEATGLPGGGHPELVIKTRGGAGSILRGEAQRRATTFGARRADPGRSVLRPR